VILTHWSPLALQIYLAFVCAKPPVADSGLKVILFSYMSVVMSFGMDFIPVPPDVLQLLDVVYDTSAVPKAAEYIGENHST
jgi:hypothetical protein